MTEKQPLEFFLIVFGLSIPLWVIDTMIHVKTLRNYALFGGFISPQPLSLKRGALSQIKALPFKGKGWDGVFRQVIHSSETLLLNFSVIDVLATFIPIITASILIYQEEGRKGIITLFKRIFDFERIGNKLRYL